MRHADAYDYVMIVYFIVLFAAANWKGNAFLNMPSKQRLAIGLGAFIPFPVWLIIQHLR